MHQTAAQVESALGMAGVPTSLRFIATSLIGAPSGYFFQLGVAYIGLDLLVINFQATLIRMAIKDIKRKKHK